MTSKPPSLYVEGIDDRTVIGALLSRHGVNTECGAKHLLIKSCVNDDGVLTAMATAIRVATAEPVGFVLDIDIDVANRWDVVRRYLRELNLPIPTRCPSDGFVDRMPGYRFDFGIWLMPDCVSDGQKLEHLIESLIPAACPIWPHAKASTGEVASIVDHANSSIDSKDRKWSRFRDVDRIKAEVRSWLAWQREPGVQLGAAINDRILGHDSPQAIAFLRWLQRLYGLPLAI